MFRAIKEFFNPVLKCKRVGHDMRVRLFKIRKENNESWGGVVIDYKAKRKSCRRCGHKEDFYDLDKIPGRITSCSMPSSMWDEMREKGFLVLREIDES